ncbi:nucleoside recognition domain protein [Desulfotomaculum nigrificans CO-1-SRB]|uniref:Nucleoside recognition domain protein n=1 Tax=Desulfotomaculum nigrificans (strain DSM 14880 / VKM B-2319 / CO-1-SRB) TaxID=868595 RepID=F6B997_DESCC|nr:spore maturation protein [Desulfotomaculum nigrificans]AEF94869.1 nucleoside recognition domain protein [Desulfotomaculum nigrificans CO-1-SRB]
MYEIINQISRWAIPVMLLVIPLAAFIKRVPVFETFVEGAEAGFATAVKTIPYLTAMLVAVSIFRASGAMELVASWLAPALNLLGVPADIIPHAVMRPLSGGAALGIATELIKTHGPDSFIGRLVSTMQGSSDTTFYVLTLYFGSVGIKKYRYAIISGLTADFTTLVASIVICKVMF